MIPNKPAPPPPPPRTCINNQKEADPKDEMKRRDMNYEKRLEEQEPHCATDAQHSIHDETKDNLNSIPKFIKHDGAQEPNTTSDDSSLLGPYHSCLKSRNQSANIFIRDGSFKEQKEQT